MKHTLLSLGLLLGLLAGTLGALPVAAQPPTQDNQNTALNVRITVEPAEIQQGRTGLVRVLELTGQPIADIQATFMGDFIDLHPSLDGDWVGFISVNMDAPRGDQPLDVYIWAEGADEPQRERINVPVVWGAFTFQNVTIQGELESLLDPNINRAEFSKLLRVQDRISDERFFTHFIRPIEGDLISDFGGIRNYNNDALQGRHTGIDFRANTGAEVKAAASGRVIFSEHLPIHGNHIIIDHGWGIMSGYSHLSERLVVPGQLVRQGEDIGLVGATGRVEGPHLHFEIIVNGEWVDPRQFLNLDLPPARPE